MKKYIKSSSAEYISSADRTYSLEALQKGLQQVVTSIERLDHDTYIDLDLARLYEEAVESLRAVKARRYE